MARMIDYTAAVLLLFALAQIINVSIAKEIRDSQQSSTTKYNPLTPKAYLSRYWNKHISNDHPKPSFLFSKASPLSVPDSTHLKNLVTHKELQSHHYLFCALANLFCLPDPLEQKMSREDEEVIAGDQATNSNGMQFANYDMQFSNYEINKNNTGSSFTNYSDETNFGLAVFKDYSKEGGSVSTFLNYTDGASFAQYSNTNESGPQPLEPEASRRAMTSIIKNLVEPGKFFREFELKEGNVMVMPDIRDKYPRRSFLPRSIVSELPFSSSQIMVLQDIFHAPENSTMERIIHKTLNECEGKPSPGETKKCVGSIEDMIDFTTTILGHDIVVRTTKNVKGSSENVMIGSIKTVNGGVVTKAISCHQSLYPYLLYYCHSVPNVRIHEVDILDVNTKDKINHGLAICHLDTSSWSPLHASFMALGYGPGKIEVCHWIYENDMSWTQAY